MCNVCVADRALRASSCGNRSCAAFQEGHAIEWSTAPKVCVTTISSISKSGEKKVIRRIMETPRVYVRARGRHPECTPATYQLRLEGQNWPNKWMKSSDLAGAMGMYGLDTQWNYVPRAMRDWIARCRKDMPTMRELHAEQKADRDRREAKAPAEKALRLAREKRIRAAKKDPEIAKRTSIMGDVIQAQRRAKAKPFGGFTPLKPLRVRPQASKKARKKAH